MTVSIPISLCSMASVKYKMQNVSSVSDERKTMPYELQNQIAYQKKYSITS